MQAKQLGHVGERQDKERDAERMAGEKGGGVSVEEVWMSARCHKTTWETLLALIRVNEIYEERKVSRPWEKVRARGFNRRSEGGRVWAGPAWRGGGGDASAVWSQPQMQPLKTRRHRP